MSLGDIEDPVLCILEEALEGDNAAGLGAIEIYVGAAHVGEDLAAVSGPGDQNVESPFATLVIERSKVHGRIAGLVFAVTDADENDVPLVSLDVLQVLDEERFLAVVGKEALARRITTAKELNLVLKHLGLPSAESGNAFCSS